MTTTRSLTKKDFYLILLFVAVVALLVLFCGFGTRGPATFRIVTAFSSNHLDEAIASCASLMRLAETRTWSKGTLIAYLLEKLPVAKLARYRKECPMAEIRTFDFAKYPSYVRNLREYRWKFLIEQTVLKEVDIVFWIDSSIQFVANATETLQEAFDAMEDRFSMCSMRMLSLTRRKLHVLTNPAMLARYRVSQEEARKIRMFEAGVHITRRSSASKAILDEMVACSLDKDCMAPPGAKARCEFKQTNTYANCHRFDQSVLNILLHRCSPYLSAVYKDASLIEVVRL